MNEKIMNILNKIEKFFDSSGFFTIVTVLTVLVYFLLLILGYNEEKTQELDIDIPKQTSKHFEEVYGKDALYWLTLNVYHEARGEPIIGQIAVAQVTLNRVYDPEFPDTVKEVVTQPWQFSWYSNKKDYSNIDNILAWKQAESVARASLTYEIYGDTTKGDLFYHAVIVKPEWASVFSPSKKIGGHIFYVR